MHSLFSNYYAKKGAWKTGERRGIIPRGRLNLLGKRSRNPNLLKSSGKKRPPVKKERATWYAREDVKTKKSKQRKIIEM